MWKGGAGKTTLLVVLNLIRSVVEGVGLVKEKCLQCLLEEECVMAEEVSDALYSRLGVISYVGCHSPLSWRPPFKAYLSWDIPEQNSVL